MSKSQQLKCKIAVGLACLALFFFVSSASATLTVTTSNQHGTAGTYPFTPPWTPASDSLIAGLAPSTTVGSFNFDNTNCNVKSLTSGVSLAITTTLDNNPAGPDPVGNTTTSSNYVSCGNANGAGSLIIYTLPANANGYNLTNITVFSGWADNGRDAQGYTVLYSTVANPGNFIYLTSVSYNPSVPSGTPTANQSVISDSSGGMIAANVAAVEFVLNIPTVENNWVGYGAITVEGTAASSVMAPAFSITTSNQSGANPFTPTWTPETPDLILGLSPTTASGNFNLETSGGTPVLTDGALGASGNVSGFATSGGGSGSGSTLIYTLTNNVINGSDVTNIITYSGWGDGGRDGQYYTVSYATIAAPTTYIPITTVYYLPTVPTGSPANRVSIAMNDGSALASGVSSIKFNFSGPPSSSSFNNGYQGYSEIIVQGHDTTAPPPPPSPLLVQDILPSYAETVVGDQVVFTATYSNFPPVNLQWQQIVTSPAATNTINTGVVNVTNNDSVTSTLTLNNVQLNNAGLYLLKAVSATNNAAAPAYTAGGSLVVSNTPTAVNNIILSFAGQTFDPSVSTNFFPAWPVTTNSLIYGYYYGGGPGTYNYVGDFTGSANGQNVNPIPCEGDVTEMSDGIAASTISSAVTAPAFVAAGTIISQVGSSVTYTLDTSSAPNGFDLTNITVFGGWADAGRNEQKYQVLYATTASPTTFVPLTSADYNPNDAANQPSVTRTMLTPASGVLAHNVVAVEFNFDASPGPKNGWEGYSEFIVQGTASTGVAVSLLQDVTPQTASDVMGSQIILTAAFNNYTTLQWQKNGTNILGATTPTLTLNNVQTNDTGAYSLVASNAISSLSSSACAVTVNPAPVPVAGIITAIATQTATYPTFTATWDPSALASSLIYNAYPTISGDGDFTGGFFGTQATAGSGPQVLTDGTFGTIDFANSQSHAWVTCMGSGAGNDPSGNPRGGNYVVYTLTGSANGYTITNIMTSGGWNDAGRDQQAYTVYYSTVDNPTYYIPLAIVNYNPANPIGYSVTRATITATGGILASNVGALEFAMYSPAGENGFSGYSEFAVYGSPSANPPPIGPVITVENQTNTFTWTVETPNLIANQLPSSTGPGVFTEEGCNETNLTDGVIGFGAAFGASCGDDGIAVPYIIFNSTSGWNLTNIVVYTLWHDYGRDGQFYNVSYSTWSAPTTFLPLASVAYNPNIPQDGRASGNRVAIAPTPGQTMLASNVAAVKFDFTPQGTQDFGWSGYTEIVLQGTNLNLIPTTAPTLVAPNISNGNLILTGTGGTPNSGYSIVGTTNLMTPLANWTVLATGLTDATGALSNSVPVNPSQPASFIRLRVP